MRTGDTPAAERQRQARDPAEILVTTPESLYLLLVSRAGDAAPGRHRDRRRDPRPGPDQARRAPGPDPGAAGRARRPDPQRIGLSATVRPLDEVARFLGGDRPVRVVDASAAPDLDLRDLVPVADMERPPTCATPPRDRSSRHALRPPAARPPPENGIWSAIYPALLEAIRAYRSTIVFVNSRGLVRALWPSASTSWPARSWCRAHHGSVCHEQRAQIEEGLKAATSAASSPPARSSWASTWARWTW